jgi:hypothetical protein
MKLKYYDENGNIKVLEGVESITLVRNNTKYMVVGQFKSFDIKLEQFISTYI